MKLIHEKTINITSINISKLDSKEIDNSFNKYDIPISDKIWIKDSFIEIEFIGNIPSEINLRFSCLRVGKLTMIKLNHELLSKLEIDSFKEISYDFTRFWCYPDNKGYIDFISFLINDNSNSEYSLTFKLFSKI